jgi:type IV pilus assembly protein PilW
MGKRLSPLQMQRQLGFGLVELLVAAAIGMVGMVVVMQVFALQEGQRRTTSAGSDAQVNGAIAIFSVERDLRVAGYGVPSGGCTSINAYDSSQSPSDLSFSSIPVKITQNTPTSGTDRIEIMASGSDFGAIPATIQTDMPNSSSILRVDSGFGLKSGQLILLSTAGQPCTLLQLSQDAQPTGTANVTATGTMWNLQHNPAAPYNPPGGHNIAPPGGYSTGSQVYSFDNFSSKAYYIQNNALYVQDLRQATGSNNPVQIVDGVIAMRAVYGRDTNQDGVVDAWDNTSPSNTNEVIAVRLGIVVRSGAYEKDIVTNAASLTLWNGGPSVALRDDTEPDVNNRDRHYRYKIYQTTVPLRNVIWGAAL